MILLNNHHKYQFLNPMNKDSDIIVIGRQFGCGGAKFGKAVAESLGIPYYDKTLLSEAALKCGLSPHLFKEADEKRPSFFRNFLGLNVGTTDPASAPGTLSRESLYQNQSELIRTLASKGSCVIVGRTADYILRDFPGLISLFIHAPIEFRIKNIIERGDAHSPEEAAILARSHDKNRESYYNYFTNRRWGVADNYHLCFDSSKINPDKLVSFFSSLHKR